MLFRKKKKTGSAPPPRSEMLRAHPVRNPAVTWGEDAQGDTVIHIPLQKSGWVKRFQRIFPSPDVRHIVLDDIGADVWQMCDGETSVEAIRRFITDKYKMNHKEAESSLLEHLRQLARRKLIVAVAGPKEPEAAGEAVRRPNVQVPNKKKKRR